MSNSMSPGEARYTADLLYRRLVPLSQTVGTQGGAVHVVSLYLAWHGVLALVHRHGRHSLALVERWPVQGPLPISRAQERYRKYVREVYGRFSDAELVKNAPEHTEAERQLWELLHDTRPAEPPDWDEALLAKQACQALAPWIDQDARAQGRPQPASWLIAQQLLHCSTQPKSALQGCSEPEVRVWAHLLYEVGLSCQEGPLEALALLRDGGIGAPAPYRAEVFLKRLQHEVDTDIPDSLRDRMQAALNSAQLHRALTLFQGAGQERPPLRYSMLDLVLQGLLPQAGALRAALAG